MSSSPKMPHLVLWVVLLFVTVPASRSVSGPHIADVNILLPPKMTHPVEYRLQGSDGCFHWSWDHHDILSVLPEYNLSSRCSTSARLRSIAPYSGRKETAVYAADVDSGIIIRCKVFIDNFSRIQIFHNSVKLDLDGLSTLRVRAFDSEENVFSSLVGLQFSWQLMPETEGFPHHLVHVPLKDSPLSDCGDLNIQIKLEESGTFSDLYVVKGIGIGHEVVSVHLLEPQFEHLKDKIVLTVAEAMSLDPPSPVLVLIGTGVHYGLKVIHGNIPQEVTLPSPYHRWSVSNSSVAEVDSMMGFAHALNLGVTTITVEDTRVVGHMQTSSLHVVIPDNLCLYLLPLSLSGNLVEGINAIPSMARWYVISGKQYVIYMKVFSRGPDAREIYITENDDVKLNFDQSYWKTSLLSDEVAVKHGWRNSRILKATSLGLGKLIASLIYSSGRPETKEVLKFVQEVMICEQVNLSLSNGGGKSHSILLPWAPAVFQEVELKANGGCAKAASDYKWFSSDMATLSVSATGVVQAKKPGKATVKVVSIFDSLNYDEVSVEVLIPSTLVMLQNFPVETVVGSHLEAAVTMKASNGAYFYRCDAFNNFIRWKAGSDSFAIVNATGNTFDLDKETRMSVFGPPCAWTYLYASSSGQTMLHATLSKEFQQYGPIVLKASSRIAAYLPLQVHQAGNGNQFGGYWFDLATEESHYNLGSLENLYLVPGSQIDVVLLGGPEHWDQNVNYIEAVEILDKKHANLKDADFVHQLSTNYGSLYRLICPALGNFKLIFKRGNLVGDDHPVPSVEELDLLLSCSLPSSIALIVDEPVNTLDKIWDAIQADRSPGQICATPVTVTNGRSIRVAAVGISKSGKAFANSSSLFLSWELNGCDGLAIWDNAYTLERARSSWERFLVLQNESGLCTVRATVTGFSNSASSLESLEDILTDAVRLQVVSTLKVNPEFNLLFFNPDAKINLSITGGSCFLDAVVNDSQVVEIIQPPPGFHCLQLILGPKGLGTTLVTVYDIGIAPPVAASAVVQVADIDWIKITSGEEISLMEGSLQSVDLLAGVSDGRTFDYSQYFYMNMCVHIEDHIVDLVEDDEFSSPADGYINAPNFTIMAKQLGVTTLYVSTIQHSGREILSKPIKVEVYAPLRILPEYIFLVPGASFVLTVKGGPTIGVSVEYASMDDEIVTVHNSSGRLTAISAGNATLLATVFGHADAVICQAHARVKVGVPPSVKLSGQSERLNVGREMPIYPTLPEGDLFSFYELCKDYKWTIDDEKVLSFRTVEHLRGDKFGVPFSGPNENRFSSYMDEKNLGYLTVLYGRSAGRANVAVSFSCAFISSGSFSQSRSYNASVSLWVVADLPLALGVSMTWILPPYYTSSSLLPSSSELFSQRDPQSHRGTITYSLLRSCGGKNEEVHRDALFIEGDRIKTTESSNLACIQAKDRTTGKTEIAACVKVAEVAQIRITSTDYPFHAIDLAVGAELKLPIGYRDVLGNPFHEAHDVILLDAVTNYPDVVSVNDTCDGNGNIHIKALRYGRALLRISLRGRPQKSDYILISVGAHLYPQNPVIHLGSCLNFSIEGLTDKVTGQWLSANASVVYVDTQSGKVHAVGEGATLVFFKGSNLELQTTVTVHKRDDIAVDAPLESLTNVPLPLKGYNFSVKFSDSYGHNFQKLTLSGSGEDVLHDCKVDPSYIGHAKPWRDLDTGNSYCLFFPYSPEHLVRSIPKLKGIRSVVSVSITASLREANHVSGSASALFIGGFSVLEIDKLDFTPDNNISIITIVGNTDVELYWHSHDLLGISLISREDFGIGGRAQYTVKVLGAKRFNDRITIMLPSTGQRVEVDVDYKPGGDDASSINTNVALWAGVLGCFAILVLTVAIFICVLDKPDRTQPPISAATPTIATPATPAHGSPVFKEQSPRTPEPFVEYVRRTIDETPYYRRDARRRFSPQHTY